MAEAKSRGQPEPVEPTVDAESELPLPESPTRELHHYFINSLLYYAHDHPAVVETVRNSFAADPTNAVNQALVNAPPFRSIRNDADSSDVAGTSSS